MTYDLDMTCMQAQLSNRRLLPVSMPSNSIALLAGAVSLSSPAPPTPSAEVDKAVYHSHILLLKQW